MAVNMYSKISSSKEVIIEIISIAFCFPKPLNKLKVVTEANIKGVDKAENLIYEPRSFLW